MKNLKKYLILFFVLSTTLSAQSFLLQNFMKSMSVNLRTAFINSDFYNYLFCSNQQSNTQRIVNTEQVVSFEIEIEDDEVYSVLNYFLEKKQYRLFAALIVMQKAKSTNNINNLLLTAAYAGNLKLVSVLIKFGAEVDCINDQLQTPLMLAVDQNHKNIVSYLIKKNAKINQKDQYGYSALNHAFKNNNLDSASCLIQNGANLGDISAKNLDYWCNSHDSQLTRETKKAFLAGYILNTRPNNSCKNNLQKIKI